MVNILFVVALYEQILRLMAFSYLCNMQKKLVELLSGVR